MNTNTWREVPLKALFRRRETTGRADLPLLSVYRDFGVVLREGRDDNYNKPSEDLSTYRVVRPGDLVLNKMKTWQGSLGVSKFSGIVSPAYFVCEQVGSGDPRFLHHLLRSEPLIAEYGKRSKGIRPAQWDLPWDEFRSITIRLPEIQDQRAIADYLDAETARIDALIEKKQRMVELLEAREQSALDTWAGEQFHRWPAVPFRRLIQRIEQGWSPQCEARPAEPLEWGVLRTSAISSGSFRPEENKHLPDEVTPNLRWVVRDGDLLMTRGSGSKTMVGQAAVAQTDGRRLMMSDLTYRLLTKTSSPDYLASLLRARRVRGELESAIRTDTGMTLKVRAEDIKDLRVPHTPLAEQLFSVSCLQAELDSVRRTQARIEDQLRLIREHRQALITAAVTGELGVAA